MFEATELNLRNTRNQHLARILLLLVTLLLITPVAIILGMLLYEGAPMLSYEFLFTEPTNGMTAGGIFPGAGGHGVAGDGSAHRVGAGGGGSGGVPQRVRARQLAHAAINLAIINLAGVPSIVHALFGVGAFVLFFEFGTSILAASLTLAVMTLPVVIVATRESLQAVPHSFREACWNMGATRWQTIRRVVLPNSISGILTGVILEVSRTAGETAPIMFTGAAFFLPFLPETVFDQTMAMSLHLFVISTQVPDVPEGLPTAWRWCSF